MVFEILFSFSNSQFGLAMDRKAQKKAENYFAFGFNLEVVKSYSIINF